MSDDTLQPVPFHLRDLTPARVSLARAGTSLATREILDFSLAHAQARDAVYATLDIPHVLQALSERNLSPIQVHSEALDRATYIRRPDLGRRLSPESAAQLHPAEAAPAKPTITLILADGLSALATNRHAIPLLDALLPALQVHFALTPPIVAEQARVALGDAIGTLLHSDLTLILIGERPGLSSPDSLGAYLTWSPRPGRTDAERNCISNIRTGGLDYDTAAARILSLCLEANRLKLTGTALKEASTAALPSQTSPEATVPQPSLLPAARAAPAERG